MTMSPPEPDPSPTGQTVGDPKPSLVERPDPVDHRDSPQEPRPLARAVLAWCVWAAFVVALILAVIAFTLAGTPAQRGERAAVASAITAAMALLTLVPGPPPGVVGTLLARLGGPGGKWIPRGSRPVTRRDLLIVAAGAAATGATVATIMPPPPRPLRVGGWDEFFLTADRTPQPWWRGIEIDPALAELSGLQLLDPGTDLSAFDAVTVPSSHLADQLEARIRALHGGFHRGRTQICTERMVILGRTELLRALIKADIVVRSEKDAVWFDLARYINRCTLTWRSQDPDLDSDERITVYAPDPRTSSGGQNYLLAIATAYANDPSHQNPQVLTPLWSADGPLKIELPAHSRQLWERLETFGLIYTYEHHALTTLSKRPGEFVMIRTRPQSVVTQYLMALTDAGLELTRRLGQPAAQQRLLHDLMIPSLSGGWAVDTGSSPHELTLASVSSARLPQPKQVAWGTKPIRADETTIERIYAQYRKR